VACKQGLAGVAVLALASCGGGAKHDWRVVRGPGFRFEAAVGWDVVRRTRAISASSGSSLVSVTVFPLVHSYSPLLFPKAAAELDGVARTLAARLGGRLEESQTVTIAGRRSRRYEIAFTRGGDAVVERIAFVLRGKREYQLLCRFRRGADDSPCERLRATFALD
jgi:hypothetical protein